ncbi:uncharacterized protein LOC127122015 [Lathyrus oleraceus]|uniref:uncharacterized protein LOC127122015 n=1 Tax=Pisum sativum TaxID=3888 RepID=UPI0021CFCD63|nr:uncharacterized protein LOC127122015 [Pisum sativum]
MEVELLILSHHFYKSSTCLDRVDVLVSLAATRVDAYVLEENGQLDLLLQKYSAAADTNTGTAEAVRGFRMSPTPKIPFLNLQQKHGIEAFIKQVELLILSHHFYKSSTCLDRVDVLVSLAATRVDAYVLEGDFPCLARLITGVEIFYALNFILGILIENGQLDLLLQKYSAAADTNTGTAEAVRGFRMAVLTSLKHFNPNDLDAFALVYTHFDMKHETATLLESRAEQSCEQWFRRYNKDQDEDLLDSMRYFIEAAEVHSSIDAGNKTRKDCAQASLLSLQIRMPYFQWLYLSETNARQALVEQSRFSKTK